VPRSHVLRTSGLRPTSGPPRDLQLKTQTSEQGFRGPNFRRIEGSNCPTIDRKTNNTAIFDGEVAVPDQRGVTHIDNLTMARHAPERLAFFAFDLLWLNGEDLRRRW
jgi:hypothetical protein